MIDFEKLPWAAWLEEIVSELLKLNVESIAIAAITGDGLVFTAYYGADATDMAVMATHINADGLLEMVLNNARMIVEAAEDQEEDDAED